MARKAKPASTFQPPPRAVDCLSLIEKMTLRDIREGVLDAQGLPFMSNDLALTYALTLARAVVIAGRAAEFHAPPLPPPTAAEIAEMARPRRAHRRP